jgi:hypothetical protein
MKNKKLKRLENDMKVKLKTKRQMEKTALGK